MLFVCLVIKLLEVLYELLLNLGSMLVYELMLYNML